MENPDVATTPRIIGRNSSHFTRVARMFAAELAVAYEFVIVRDLSVLDPIAYGGHPALKIPVLIRGDSALYGTQNICKELQRISSSSLSVLWPGSAGDRLLANANELVAHCMAVQVQVVLGTVVDNLPAQGPFFSKLFAGLDASVEWLDRELPEVLKTLPPCDLSWFEVTLYCLIEHLNFRRTMAMDRFGALADFRDRYGERDSARGTAYFVDTVPTG